jgi:hypothetical protein
MSSVGRLSKSPLNADNLLQVDSHVLFPLCQPPLLQPQGVIQSRGRGRVLGVSGLKREPIVTASLVAYRQIIVHEQTNLLATRPKTKCRASANGQNTTNFSIHHSSCLSFAVMYQAEAAEVLRIKFQIANSYS